MGDPVVYCIGTMDTKEAELNYLYQQLSSSLSRFLRTSQQVKAVIVDVSTTDFSTKLEGGFISSHEVIKYHPDENLRVFSSLPHERGAAGISMSLALEGFMKNALEKGNVLGAVGVGGSGGTAILSPAFRCLPIGIPKLIVSTVASGNTSPYVEFSDLILFPSVVDISGLNRISTRVLSNAAAAFAGMVAAEVTGFSRSTQDQGTKRTVGITMFGVTTPCVTAVRKNLEKEGYETLVFHATGAGGKAMEYLVSQGHVQAVLDITTTEVADNIVGGVMACNDDRFLAMVEKDVPLLLSVGALDMVNFGSIETVPSEFSKRNLFMHNKQVTLMRTTADENRKFARFIAERINKSRAPVRVVLPTKGVSALDAEGMPFFNNEVTIALLQELESSIEQTSERQVRKYPFHINDPEFVNAIVANFLEIAPPVQQLPTGSNVEHPLSFNRASIPSVSPHAKKETVKAREAVLERLRKQMKEGVAIIGAGAGTGISAKFEEEGGVDLIVVYNSGRFRMAGRGSLAGLLPFKDANAVVIDMANEVLPIVKRTPVLAGVCGTDPFRRMGSFLRELEEIGFVGVQNFPTVGLFDGIFRQNLEETGMGFGLEVEMIRQAHEMGLLTTPYAFNVEESKAMASVGADIIVAHMGLTTSGSIGATTALTLDESIQRVQAITDAARSINPDVIVLCHGGPIASAEDAEYVVKRCKGVDGFYGASSIERLPVEDAIVNTVRKFKSIIRKVNIP